MNTHAVLASCVVAILCLSAATAGAQSAPQTGTAFRKELDGITDIAWRDQRALRDALTHLSEAKRIAIVLDRRVDPDQKIEFSVSDVSLEQALRQLATRLKLGVTFFDSTVYLGPESVTYRIATVAAIQHDRATQATEPQRARLRSLPAQITAELSTPRELLTAWAESCQLTLQGIERVPHDLWPSLNLPAQTAATRATLLLAGFDLAMEFSTDGKAARIVPMPEQATLTKKYAGGTNPKNRAQQIAKQFPRLEIANEGSQIVITGSFEDHDLIARLLRGEKIRRVDVGPGIKNYTLNVENQPLAAVARAVAKELKMEVEFDPTLNEKLDQRVSFKVKDATLEELFQAMLRPVDLDFLFMENKVKIMPKKD